MRYNLVPLVATTIFAIASANVAVPDGSTHNPNWGNAIVKNQCSFSIYYVLDNSASGKQTISAGSSITVPVYEKNADKGGMSIKLFKDPSTDLWNNPSLTQFELTATSMLFYDISNVNSNIGNGVNGNGQALSKAPPFMNDGLKMVAGDGKTAVCKAGENPCKNAYSKYDDDFATAATDLANDVTLIICPDGSSSGGSSDSGSTNKQNNQGDANSASAPSTTPKPAASPSAAASPKVQEVKVEQKNAKADADVVYVTQVVTAPTEQVTIWARSPAEEKEKRHEHLHQHVHNKIHKRRHEA